jgi:hypothetical protein
VTVSIGSEEVTEPADRPRTPIAAAVVVVAALLAGAGALGASSVLSSDPVRLALAVALVVVGVGLTRLGRDPHHPLTLALGSSVLRGVGTSYGVLGAYLGGLALLTASLPDGPVFAGDDTGPSPIVVILMVYGIPALALLAVATTGMRAWTAAAGAVLPMVTVLLMANAGAGAAAVSVTMLAAGALLAVVVVRAPRESAWGDLASAAAAMATSFAFGAGTSPFGSLGATQLAGAQGESPGGTLPEAALVVVVSGSLLVAAVLLLVAVLRKDLAGGVLVGSIFAMPPVLLSTWLPAGSRWPAGALVAQVGVPVLVVLLAILAIRLPRFRDALVAAIRAARPARSPEPTGARAEAPDTDASDSPSPATESDRPDGGWFKASDTDPEAASDLRQDGAGERSRGDRATGRVPSPWPRNPRPPGAAGALAAASCAVVVVTAAVVFVVAAVPVFGWDPRAQGALTLLALVVAGALGYWLPRTPGAAASVVALLGLGLASPWARLLTGAWAGASLTERVLTGVLDLGSAAALAWFLLRRHPRPGVFAAAAYTFAAATAAFLGALLLNADYLATNSPPFDSELAPVAIIAAPLLLIGLAAVVAVFRGQVATGQAVGAVVLAAGGFLPLKILVGEFAQGGADGLAAGYALQTTLNPFTPTDWLQTSYALREVTGPALAAVIAMVLLALLLAVSLGTRPSAPLAAAVALVLLAAVQSSLLTVLSSGSTDEAELLGQVLGGLAVLVAAIAAAVAIAAARSVRRD